MITAILYLIAYFAVMKFIPGIKDESGQIDAKLFIASVGSFVGIIEGIFAWIKSRHWIAFVLAPLVCAAVTAAAWFTAAALPWTRSAESVPNLWGFIALAFGYNLIASIPIKLFEIITKKITKTALEFQKSQENTSQSSPPPQPAPADKKIATPAPENQPSEESVDPFAPPSK